MPMDNKPNYEIKVADYEKTQNIIDDFKENLKAHSDSMLNIMYVFPKDDIFTNMQSMPIDRNIQVNLNATSYSNDIYSMKNNGYEMSISFSDNPNLITVGKITYDNTGHLITQSSDLSFNQFFSYVYGCIIDKKILLENLIKNQTDFEIISRLKKYITDINILESFIIKCVKYPAFLSHDNYDYIKSKFLVLSVGADYNDNNTSYTSIDNISSLNDFLDDYLVSTVYDLRNFQNNKSYCPYCIIDVFDICMKRLIDTNKPINICELCGKVFIPERRSDEKYCKLPNIAEKFETCWNIKDKIRSHYNQNKDELSRLYYLVYNRLRARFGTDAYETIEFREKANKYKKVIKDTPSDELIKEYREFLIKSETDTKRKR